MATLRAQNGRMVSSSKGSTSKALQQTTVITPTANETFDAEFVRDISAWAEVNVDA